MGCPYSGKSSWTWHKVLQSRELMRGKITTVIGNGQDKYLWYDYWLPKGRLCNLFPLRMLNAIGLAWNAKVSDIIKGNSWRFPRGNGHL